MDAKLDNFSEISKLLSVKSKMSSDNLSLFSKFGLGRLLCRLSLEKYDGFFAVQLILSLCLLTIRRIAFSGSVSWLLSVLSWILLFLSWLLFQLIVPPPCLLVIHRKDIEPDFKRMGSHFSYEPLFMPIRLVQHYLWKRCFSWLKDQNVHFQRWAISKVSTDNSSMGSTLRMGENRLKLLHSFKPNKWQLDFYLQNLYLHSYAFCQIH